MTKDVSQKKFYEGVRYWLVLLNVAEPSGLKQEVDKLIELRNMLGAMAQEHNRAHY